MSHYAVRNLLEGDEIEARFSRIKLDDDVVELRQFDVVRSRARDA